MNNAQYWYGTGAAAEQGDEISQSLRLNGTALTKTYSSEGANRTKFTFSTWYKRVRRNEDACLFSCSEASNNNIESIEIEGGGKIFLRLLKDGSSTPSYIKESTALLRDDTAWYHIFVVRDTTQAVPEDRIKIYVNGVRITNWNTSTDPGPNSTIGYMGRDIEHSVGRRAHLNTADASGYLAETIYLDSHAEPSPVDKVGRFNPSGVWVPIEPTFTSNEYGLNGFRLQYANDAAFGTDTAPTGGTHANPNTYAETAGINGTSTANEYSKSLDTPTNNFCINSERGYNFFVNQQSSHGGLFIRSDGADVEGSVATFELDYGKWYWEFRDQNPSINAYIGVTTDLRNRRAGNTPALGDDDDDYGYRGDGQKRNGTTGGQSYGAAYNESGDKTIGVALDIDNNAIWFHKNGTWQGGASVSEIQNGDTSNAAYSGRFNDNAGITPIYGDVSSGSTVFGFYNFGAQAFSEDGFRHAAPTGYKKLNTSNLTEPTIKKSTDYFFEGEYNGNGQNNHQITACDASGDTIDFQPDLVIIKRNNASGSSWAMFDSCRGEGKFVRLNQDVIQNNSGTDTLTAFNANGGNGFTLGDDTDSGNNGVNLNGAVYSMFLWKGGGKPTATNSNAAGTAQTAGSVKVNGSNSSFAHGTIAVDKMSVNTESGISIVTWTGTGSTGTIPHGLGSNRPQMVWVKNYENSDNNDQGWRCWHHAFGNHSSASNNGAYWNFSVTTGPAVDNNIFGNTSSGVSPNNADHVFTVGASSSINKSGSKYVAICFSAIKGYSHFGLYHGNNRNGTSDGSNPRINCGFAPAMFWEWNDSAGHFGYWMAHHMTNDKEGAYANQSLRNQSSDGFGAGSTSSGFNGMFVAQGVKILSGIDEASESLSNNSVHLTFAFAKRPFGGENTAPSPAYF